jgi:hypothetical protein
MVQTKTLTNFYKNNFGSLSFIEFLIVTISILAIISTVVLSYFYQNLENIDIVKEHNIESLITGLNKYYEDSSFNNSTKRYPVAKCSNLTPNIIDYEYTLKNALSKPISKANNFSYIAQQDFPQDKSASYQNIEIKKADKEKRYECLAGIDTRNYSTDNKSCTGLFCYTYTSTPIGDSYTIAIFKNRNNKYLKFKQSAGLKLEKFEVDSLD